MKYVIWSEEHGAWWDHPHRGYTRSLEHAHRFSRAEATEIARSANEHLDPNTGRSFNEFVLPDPLEWGPFLDPLDKQ